MPKKLMVIPDKVRKGGSLNLGKIPVNKYSRSVTEELESGSGVTVETCLRVYRDMAVIREFETMLDNILAWSATRGVMTAACDSSHSTTSGRSFM